METSINIAQQRHIHTIDITSKKNNVAFVKRMKKKNKSRVDTKHELFNEYKSEELVKPNTALPGTRREPLSVKKQK